MRDAETGSISVRRANPMDEAIIDMLADRMADFPVPAWRTRGEIAGSVYPLLRDAVHERGRDCVLLVAEHADDGPQGGVLLRTEYDEWSGRPQARVVVLAVSHAAQARGVARCLLESAQEWAREQNLRTLICQVFEHNWHASDFFEHQGFHRDIVHFVKPL